MSNKKEKAAETVAVEGGTLAPKLRFPEFRNTGEWLKRKLGSLGSFTGGGTPDKNNFSYWEGMNPWVSSSDISDDSIYEIKISRFISDQAIQETSTKIVPENSILLVSRVGVGKIAITRNKICTSQDFTNFTPDEANLVFLAYSLKTMRDKFLSFNQGMAIKGFTKNDVSSLEVPLPVEPREQQKIADCLASVDELITLESQKLDRLKLYKKGLMQQLFPAEGQTVPRLRFQEFQAAWRSLRMSEIYTFKGNNSLSRDKLNYISGSFKNIHYGDIHTKFMQHFHAEIEFVPYINDGESHSTIRPDNYCMAGDMVFADASEDITDIGRAIEIIDAGNTPLVSGLHTILARPKKDYFALGFGAYLFSSEGIRKQIRRESQGIKVLGLSSTRLGNVILCYPQALDEQKKIADSLASVDDLITTQIQKIDALKTHRIGLMQQLFPMMGEM